MRVCKYIQNFVLGVMLAVIAIAYTGKALHSHSDSYYDSLRNTRSAASNGMSDDCPICHFNLLLFFISQSQALLSAVVLLTVITAVDIILRTVEPRVINSLRAPPVLL